MNKKPHFFKGRFNGIFTVIVMVLSGIVAYLIYTQVLGNPTNFEGGLRSNQPLKGNYLGVIYKGGPVVILLLTFQIVLITFIIERLLTMFRARGKSNNKVFLRNIQEFLENNEREEVLKACDKQKGSLANVIRSGLSATSKVEGLRALSRKEKEDLLEKELKESAMLEYPMLNENMVVISTLASISTLIGLLGTVTGMIKAFSALARVGAPDAIGLASGISQALVTTALGISTAAVAIVAFNYFSARIERINFAIEEISYNIVHTFKTRFGSFVEVPAEKPMETEAEIVT